VPFIPWLAGSRDASTTVGARRIARLGKRAEGVIRGTSRLTFHPDWRLRFESDSLMLRRQGSEFRSDLSEIRLLGSSGSTTIGLRRGEQGWDFGLAHYGAGHAWTLHAPHTAFDQLRVSLWQDGSS